MKKILLLVAAFCLVFSTAVSGPVVSSAEASPANYSYAQRPNKGLTGKRIQIRCHGAAGYVNLPVGGHSRTYCGSNGWVDYIRNPDGGWLYADPIGGGAERSYGKYYSGTLAAGYWDVWLSAFNPKTLPFGLGNR